VHDNVISAYQKNASLLGDIARSAKDSDELRVWWLGQSGFLVRHDDSFLLLDPYLSDSLTLKYASTDKPHTRMSERALDPRELRDIAVVTSSHNHTDHLDAETLRPIFESNADVQFVIAEANRDFVTQRLGTEISWPIGLDDRRSAAVAGWQITGIAAAHNEFQTDAAGRHHFLGFIIRRGPWTLYHSGDTLLYPGLADTLSEQDVDVAFLPINGNDSRRRVAGNMDGAEAALLACDAGIRWVIPHHFNMFEFNTADPETLFVPECKRLGVGHRVLCVGEGWTVPPRN
jgi:L-ascorbate metabolism protein UlaG (beta-lactamase superfamily)